MLAQLNALKLGFDLFNRLQNTLVIRAGDLFHPLAHTCIHGGEASQDRRSRRRNETKGVSGTHSFWRQNSIVYALDKTGDGFEFSGEIAHHTDRQLVFLRKFSKRKDIAAQPVAVGGNQSACRQNFGPCLVLAPISLEPDDRLGLIVCRPNCRADCNQRANGLRPRGQLSSGRPEHHRESGAPDCNDDSRQEGQQYRRPFHAAQLGMVALQLKAVVHADVMPNEERNG